MKRIFILFLSLFLMISEVRAASAPPRWGSFYSLYYEGVYLNRADTLAGLIVPRLGVKDSETGVELYGVMRAGMDSRTFLEESDQIYNDNFLFLGIGVDQASVFPGVRLSFQIGHTMDLNPKIHLGGFDLRSGFMTYHEMSWIPRKLRSEYYSEGFYVHRYRNFLGGFQVRTFAPLIGVPGSPYEGMELGPELRLQINGDTEGYDYNRFVEAQAGIRLEYHTPLAIALHVLEVFGRRLELDSPVGAYTDFRVLLTGMFGI